MWDKITVEQYQLIHSINKEPGDQLDKLLRIVSVLYNMTETELNNQPVTEFHRMTAEVTELFSKPLQSDFPCKIIRASGKRYAMSYEVGKLRLAQYIEAQHFLKDGVIETLHLIAASISRPVRYFWTGKNDSSKHEEVSKDFLQANFLKTYNSVVFFCTVFDKWNKGYKGLFGVSDNEGGEEGPQDRDEFNQRYGWIYSTTQIKDHEGITLDQAFNLSVIQAFNDLAYLKALKQYEKELIKKQHAVNIE